MVPQYYYPRYLTNSFSHFHHFRLPKNIFDTNQADQLENSVKRAAKRQIVEAENEGHYDTMRRLQRKCEQLEMEKKIAKLEKELCDVRWSTEQ
uniref:Uncharacterized protein n=1 Tax=Caenorhabditis japonica TaxID=281687 RepID=A0A8R1E4Y2_CAEJA